jgi:hypothetical protein
MTSGSKDVLEFLSTHHDSEETCIAKPVTYMPPCVFADAFAHWDVRHMELIAKWQFVGANLCSFAVNFHLLPFIPEQLVHDMVNHLNLRFLKDEIKPSNRPAFLRSLHQEMKQLKHLIDEINYTETTWSTWDSMLQFIKYFNFDVPTNMATQAAIAGNIDIHDALVDYSSTDRKDCVNITTEQTYEYNTNSLVIEIPGNRAVEVDYDSDATTVMYDSDDSIEY